MGTVNSVMIIGNLGADPELRFTGAGKAVCNLSIATTHKPKDQAEQTEWHKVVAWGKDAENCSKYLTKGRSVCIQGRLATRSWEKDGMRHKATEIMAERITFLGPGESLPKPQQAIAAPQQARLVAQGPGNQPANSQGAPSDSDDDVNW